MGVALYGKSAMQLWLHRFNALDTCAALGVGAASFVARFAARSGRRLKQGAFLHALMPPPANEISRLSPGAAFACLARLYRRWIRFRGQRGFEALTSSILPAIPSKAIDISVARQRGVACARARACGCSGRLRVGRPRGDLGAEPALRRLFLSGSSGALVRCEPLSSMRRVSGFIERSAGLAGSRHPPSRFALRR